MALEQWTDIETDPILETAQSAVHWIYSVL
jgi:hypothetical protein